MNILSEDFYLKDGIALAKDLLGKVMVREEAGKNYFYRIVETESYMGADDKGAHVYGNKKTKRTAPLFEVGGTTYIYLIYGMYHCLNISANEIGIPHCVLIRAVEPMDAQAIDYAKQNRGIRSKKMVDLTNGPGKLCKALNIDKSLNAHLVTKKGPLWIGEGQRPNEIIMAKRINIPYAEEYKDMLWRFYIKDNPFVSVINKNKE